MPGPRIVLVRTKESANVGAAARAMLNFGLDELWLVAPRCRVDHRAYALASHAEAVLKATKVVETVEEAITGTSLVAGTSARVRAADNYLVLGPREAAARLAAAAKPADDQVTAAVAATAVLFGPEDHGLANDELTRCQFQIVIPTGAFASLNLAQAVLVVAYEVALASREAVAGFAGNTGVGADADGVARVRDSASAQIAEERAAPATRDQLERFYSQLQAAMLHVGYTDGRRSPGVMRLFRGLLDRTTPTANELAALRGLLTQLIWAADQAPERVPGNRPDRPPG